MLASMQLAFVLAIIIGESDDADDRSIIVSIILSQVSNDL
jgi:hypothetical protein